MKEKSFDICPNCGFDLETTDKYCSVCGQKNQDFRIPFVYLVGDFLSTQLNIDNRILQTLKKLFLRPGELSILFVEGVRNKFTNPFKFYLFSSVIFIFVVGFFLNAFLQTEDAKEFLSNVIQGAKTNQKEADVQFLSAVMVLNEEIKQQDTLGYFKDKLQKVPAKDSAKTHFKNRYQHLIEKDAILGFSIDSAKNKTYLVPKLNPIYDTVVSLPSKLSKKDFREIWLDNVRTDSLIKAHESDESMLNFKTGRNVFKLIGLFTIGTPEEIKEQSKKFTLDFIQLFVYLILILIPISSFVLYLIQRKKRSYYFEHFIFNLQLHGYINIVHIVVLLLLLMNIKFFNNNHTFLIILLISYFIYWIIYLEMAFMRFYHGRNIWNYVKFIFFSGLYLFLTYVLFVGGLFYFIFT